MQKGTTEIFRKTSLKCTILTIDISFLHLPLSLLIFIFWKENLKVNEYVNKLVFLKKKIKNKWISQETEKYFFSHVYSFYFMYI